MALQTLPGGLIYPNPLPVSLSTIPGYTSTVLVIDAADEKVAFIFQVPATGNITAIEWRTATVTTGTTLDIRLETVDATTGNPTGTLQGTNTNGSQVVADANDNVWFSTTLTASASVTKGDFLAIVIVNPSASFGNMQISAWNDGSLYFPYNDLYAAAAWTKGQQQPIMALSYGGTYYSVAGAFPYSALNTIIYNTGSAADEIALKFKLPMPSRVIGGWAWVDIDANLDIVLYDSNGSTALASVSIDTDLRVSVNSSIHYFEFSSSVNLSKDVYYYLSIKPTTVTSITLSYFAVSAVAVMDACVGGQNAHYASRADAGAWTAVTTQRPFVSILLDAFDDGVGGSGGILVNPGLTGGMNG